MEPHKQSVPSYQPYYKDRSALSDNIVFHKPLAVGDNLTSSKAIVMDCKLQNGVKVSDRAIITTQRQADAFVP